MSDEGRRGAAKSAYRKAAGYPSGDLDGKKKVLELLGRSDLVKLFEGWSPRVSPARKVSEPLNQRVSITVTEEERNRLSRDVEEARRESRADGARPMTLAQFIRDRAVASVDIQGWHDRARQALDEVEDVAMNRHKLESQCLGLAVLIDDEDDEGQRLVYLRKRRDIENRLALVTPQSARRAFRLSGRMSTREAEVVRWRAARLCLSTSDYLRMMLFCLEPGQGDAHLPLNSKRRFYVSVLDVADHGWGEPPHDTVCAECERLRARIAELERENTVLRAA